MPISSSKVTGNHVKVSYHWSISLITTIQAASHCVVFAVQPHSTLHCASYLVLTAHCTFVVGICSPNVHSSLIISPWDFLLCFVSVTLGRPTASGFHGNFSLISLLKWFMSIIFRFEAWWFACLNIVIEYEDLLVSYIWWISFSYVRLFSTLCREKLERWPPPFNRN